MGEIGERAGWLTLLLKNFWLLMFLFPATFAAPCPAVHPTPPMLPQFLVVSLMRFLQAAEGERNIHRLCDGIMANGRLRNVTPTYLAPQTST